MTADDACAALRATLTFIRARRLDDTDGLVERVLDDPAPPDPQGGRMSVPGG